jgi:ketosteroid isomerase-like protein
MSDQDANVTTLKDAYRRWHETRGGSVDQWMTICAENIKFASLAQGAPKVEYLTAYNSRNEMRKYFEGLLRDWEMIEYRADHFIAQGDRVVMVGHCSWRAKATGKVVSTPKCDVWRFEGGKAVEFYEFFDTAQVVSAMS